MSKFYECHNLDSFLSGELAPGDAAAFDAHLATCAGCSEVVHQQRWIDGLLRSPIRGEIESPPPVLADTIGESLARRRRRRRLAACGLAAAAVLVVTVGWTLRLNRQASHRAETVSVAASSDTIAPAVFIAGDDVIVVPVASRHPNVTVVRVYPTYRADTVVPAVPDESPTSDETIRSEGFKGG